MGSQLVLFVNEDAVATVPIIDIVSGEVRERKTSPKAVCQGLRYTPMTPALCDHVLYNKKGMDSGQGRKPVRLGDLGPYVLARVVDGRIQNGFGHHDIPKPLRISEATLRELAGIFAGSGAKRRG